MTLGGLRPAVTTNVRFVHIAPRRMLAVDGRGEPGGDAFQAALGALYPVAYGLHFALRARGVNARVGPLEGLWWRPDALTADGQPRAGDPRLEKWTLLLEVPSQAAEEDVEAAIAAARRKRRARTVESVRVVTVDEGESAEVIHVGPYAAEAPTIARLHAAIATAGCRPRGRHHEIYLGDPRRAAPERLRTLIRQPVS